MKLTLVKNNEGPYPYQASIFFDGAQLTGPRCKNAISAFDSLADIFIEWTKFESASQESKVYWNRIAALIMAKAAVSLPSVVPIRAISDRLSETHDPSAST